MEPTGRTALLTGAAGGIGRALARALAAEGVRLALVDRDGPGLEALAAELGGPHTCYTVDLTERSALGPLVDQVVTDHGELALLVCNAGLTVHGPFAEHSLEEIDRVLEVDLRSVLHLVHHALPRIREARGGHIALIASMAGEQAYPFQSTYSAAKHALVGFGTSLRMELGPEGIGVTSVRPGTIATDFIAHGASHDLETTTQMVDLMRRYGTSPERVATRTVTAIRRNRGVVRVGWDSHLQALALTLCPPLVPGLLGLAARWHLRR